MIIVLSKSIRDSEKEDLKRFLEGKGYRLREIVGEEETVIGAVGISAVDVRQVAILPGVERVIPISKPYKLASRELKREDTIVEMGPVKIGGLRISVIAGPCAVESREQILSAAAEAREAGAVMLRGGAYKPRTSPYSFQGLGEEGLKYLKEAGEREGMPVVSEIVAAEHVDMMKEYIDAFQVGARNMQNFELLKRLGAIGKPVILKRGLSATIEEWLMAAEYLLAHGTDDVILCERGIRTFETYTRNTLDISAIPVVKKLSHLPVIVDPSHATGIRAKVPPLALAAVAAGADGLIVEMHPDPDTALSDGPQSLYPNQLEKLLRDIEALTPVLGKELARLPERGERKEKPSYRVAAADTDKVVAFQGEEGAYSETALHHYFGQSGTKAHPCQRFEDVFRQVLTGVADYGIIPLENSLSGSIHENYDLLLQYPDIKIVGEQKIRIEHNLIGVPGATIEDIRKVYSHPQGLAQCSVFLGRFPQWERIPFYDTAGSVEFIAGEGKPENAAIAGSEAARVYKMEVLKQGIETNPRNYTRFAILASADHSEIEKPSKASMVFSVPDRPGALYSLLQKLAARKLNMKKLESRPILGKPWEYMFYVDIEVPENLEDFHSAVEDLKTEAEEFRVLGLYRA
ncbi:MAG: 3-deoxy-7-phosphoheptulonate synthase [Spirochaetia bacterium]